MKWAGGGGHGGEDFGDPTMGHREQRQIPLGEGADRLRRWKIAHSLLRSITILKLCLDSSMA